MEPKTLLTLIAILIIIVGIYSIYASIKNKHKDYSQRKLKHRIIQELLGINGARILYGLLGFIFIIFGTITLFQFHVKPQLGNEYNNKTNQFTLTSKTVNSEDFIITSSSITTLNKLEQSIKIIGEDMLNDYVEVSFKNNYMTEIPEVVWKMKNLKIIDLTYNNISDINISKISQMDSLKRIVLTNNPISKEKIEEIKRKTNIKIN